jgi:hypothetical protein
VNWKGSLLGALLVVISGLLVGIAIGGQTTTKVLRLTVTQPGGSKGSSSVSTTQSSTSTTTSTSSTAASGPQQFLDDYISSRGVEKLNRDASRVSLDNSASEEQLQGKTYSHAVAFDIESLNEGNTATFQLPTPGFSRIASKAIGLETNTKANLSYHLTVYKNTDGSSSSVVLYEASFHGPSEVHKMDFSIQGATDILFVWSRSGSEGSYEPNVFIMADPVMTAEA